MCEFCVKPIKKIGIADFFKQLPAYGDDGNFDICLRLMHGSWTIHIERFEYNEDGAEYCEASENIPIMIFPICGRELKEDSSHV